jgi:phosphate transport system substrate-binding protein
LNLARGWLRPALPITVAATLILAACGNADAGSSDGGGGNGNGGDAGGGSVFVSGSSTVEPITALVAELYAEENSGFDYTVEGPGTGDGFALFCNGETDISDASRAISEEEIAACEEAGIEYTEILVAYDGLAVITSADNDAVSCLSFADLYALLGPESQDFNTWAAADDLAGELPEGFGELHAPYPDADLVVTAPGEESGTFDSFVEIALEDIAEERGQDATTRPDYVASPNDNVIIEGITGTTTSLGWVGLAFASENSETVKIIEVDGGDGCVAPSDETVVDGSYPIARPLFIYVNNARADENPTLVSFVDYYLANLDAAGEVGYVNLSDDEMAASTSAWEGR